MLHQLWLRPEGLQNQKYVPSGPLQEQFVDLCSRKWQKQDLNQLLLCKALNCFAVPVFCSIPVLDAQQRLEKPFFPVPLNVSPSLFKARGECGKGFGISDFSIPQAKCWGHGEAAKTLLCCTSANITLKCEDQGHKFCKKGETHVKERSRLSGQVPGMKASDYTWWSPSPGSGLCLELAGLRLTRYRSW